MRYQCVLIVVKDMERSKRFYKDILGLDVIMDFGANATLEGNIALQTLDSWTVFIGKQAEDIGFRGNSGELCFEHDDIDDFVGKLDKKNISYVHPLLEYPWGQRVIRFYDPDGHMIEVGENMSIVVKRFIAQGLSVEETAERMGVPVEYVMMNE